MIRLAESVAFVQVEAAQRLGVRGTSYNSQLIRRHSGIVQAVLEFSIETDVEVHFATTGI